MQINIHNQDTNRFHSWVRP